MRSRYFAVLMITLVLAAPARAVTILKMDVGARPTAMGDASAGMYSDITASCWNPAGLACIARPELGLMHADAVTDASLEFTGFAYPVPRVGVFSLSGMFYMIRPIPVTLDNGQSLGDLTWMDSVLAVSFARRLTPALSGGVSAKVVQQIEDDPIFGRREGSAFAVDAGIVCATPWKGLQAGCALLNTGSDLRMTGQPVADPLPQTARLGLAYEHPLNKTAALTVAGDLSKVLGGAWYPGMGIEMKLHEIVFLRTGYYAKEGNIQGTTYGFGIRIRKFEIDYSNVPASEMVGFSRNNKISLLVHF